MTSVMTGISDRRILRTNLSSSRFRGRSVPPSATCEILIPNGIKHSDIRPIRAETRAMLVRAIARGRLWLSQIQSGAVTNVQDIAAREKCSKRHVNMTLSLAVLAPSLVKAAIDGRLPRGIGVARMFDLPPGWACQYESLGLVAPLSQ
jgi:hypothetical protein